MSSIGTKGNKGSRQTSPVAFLMDLAHHADVSVISSIGKGQLIWENLQIRQKESIWFYLKDQPSLKTCQLKQERHVILVLFPTFSRLSQTFCFTAAFSGSSGPTEAAAGTDPPSPDLWSNSDPCFHTDRQESFHHWKVIWIARLLNNPFFLLEQRVNLKNCIHHFGFEIYFNGKIIWQWCNACKE